MSSYILFILQSVYILIPAGFANMAPVIFNRFFKFLARPIDFGLKYKGKRILGDHKTWRGLLTGIAVAILVVYVQKNLHQNHFFRSISIIDYGNVSVWFLGFVLGFGALFGDMVKSFFKRRMDMKPGQDWFPFDQMDWVVGAALFLQPIYIFSPVHFLVSIVVYFFLHLIVKQIGYWLKLDRKSA